MAGGSCSIRVASLKIEREKEDENEDDDEDDIDDVQRFPVGGASVEEIATGDADEEDGND